jgi:hypothetical protein
VCFATQVCHGRTGLILFVGGGGGGAVLVCPTALLTQYTYTTLFEIFKDFPMGGGAFFKKGPFCEIIY